MIKTLADVPQLMNALYAQDRQHHPFDATCPSTPVFAPCCGRVTAADSIIDVRAVAGTVVSGGGHQPPRDHDWLCDGCRHRMVADPENDWTFSKLTEASGASREEVQHHRAREHAKHLERTDHAAERAHEPEKAWAIAVAHARSLVR